MSEGHRRRGEPKILGGYRPGLPELDAILDAKHKIRDGDASEEPGAVAKLTALLDARPEVLVTVDEAKILDDACTRGWFDVVELLLARGAAPHGGCLAALLTHGDVDRVIDLVERLVACGADPSEREFYAHETPLGHAAAAGLRAVQTLLRLGADQNSALMGLHVAVPRAAADPACIPLVEHLLAHLDSVDAPGTCWTGEAGLSALHIVALRGTATLLALVLERGPDLAAPVIPVVHWGGIGDPFVEDCMYWPEDCDAPDGSTMVLRLVPGSTARDLVVTACESHELASVWNGDADEAAGRRARRRAQLAEVLDLLIARGAPPGKLERPAPPRFAAEIDALLVGLAEHVGADVDALARIIATIPMRDCGPWDYTITVLERSRPVLLRGVVAERTGDSWLAYLIAGEHHRFTRERRAPPEPSAYPEAARLALTRGNVVGARDEALLVMWPQDGVARLGVAAPDAFAPLGDDMPGFLRHELRALGVATAG